MRESKSQISVRESPSTASHRRLVCLAGFALVLVSVAAFYNSFAGVMVMDDHHTIVKNESIRDLRNVYAIWSPPLDTTVSGRPLANVSLAINYAFDGFEPFGYHVVNLIIHALAGLTLFGVFRRTLLHPALATRFGKAALPLAWLIAMLWLIHPLQTESVTYIVQRVEALAGLFYLLTLYLAIRAMETSDVHGERGSAGWQVAAVMACWLGVASKEVIVSAPLLVLLYDRTLVAGTFHEAFRMRRWLYLGLAASWLMLGCMILGAKNRAGTAGFGTASSWEYLLTQCRGIVHYLRLVFWPSPQVFDYGTELERDPIAVWPQALFLIAVGGATIWAGLKQSAWSLPGVFFFAVLAPSSSIIPVATQTLAEHRMYLPLAAVVAVCVIAGYARFGRAALVAGVGAGVVLTWATIKRNEIYHSNLALWTETAAVKPDSPRAVCTLGETLFEIGRKEEAVAKYEEALRLRPNYFEALNNLGIALVDAGRLDEAKSYFEAAVAQRPMYGDVRGNLGMVLYAQGQPEKALAECEESVRLLPNSAEMRSNLSIVLQRLGRIDDSIRECREAIRCQPKYPEVHNNLGMALAAKGQSEEAVRAYDEAIRLKPIFAEAHMNRGLALWALDGHEAEAVRSYEEALRCRADYYEAHNNLATSLVVLGKIEEAIPHYKEAMAIRPESGQVYLNLGNALLRLRRWEQALPHCETAVKLSPENAEARVSLGTTLFFTGRIDASVEQLREAVRIDPNYFNAHYFLGNVYLAQRNREGARRHLEEAIRLNPNSEPARQSLDQLRY